MENSDSQPSPSSSALFENFQEDMVRQIEMIRSFDFI